jgi:hypothetical protein
MQRLVLVGAFLIGNCGAARLRVANNEQDVPHPMVDCFQKRPVFISRDTQVSKGNLTAKIVPGAGMTLKDIVPFQTVLKDGYFSVGCLKDHMYYFGDKFGDNKFDYNQGEISNTSIVLYSKIVPKGDRKPMSPAVCFSFCRTVPDMMFFGIVNGENCYCTPFFHAMADDNDQCDEACPGSRSEICGSKVKSTMFEMHMCQDFGDEMKENMEEVKEKFGVTVAMVTDNLGLLEPKGEIQTVAKNLQTALGSAADPGASDLMQTFKATVAELYSTYLKNKGVLEDMAALEKEVNAAVAAAKPGPDGRLPYDEVKKMEKARDELRKLSDSHAAKTMENFPTMMSDVYPEDLVISAKYKGPYNATKGLSDTQYYPAMFFVDKTHMMEPATCTGDLDGRPKVATRDGCATACERALQTCVGFSWMPIYNLGFAPEGFCFLFSKLKTVQYYTGCTDQHEFGKKFNCMAKYSRFDGTSIEPKPKCDTCLKDAKKADRCISMPLS